MTGPTVEYACVRYVPRSSAEPEQSARFHIDLPGGDAETREAPGSDRMPRLLEVLNDLAGDGWRLVAVEALGSTPVYWIERPLG